MISIRTVLLLLAVIFWIFATFNWFVTPPRVNWWYAGWLCILLVVVFSGLKGLIGS